jgi:16S rRNA C1402 (ribose-2'-O) methylase RsmI
MRAQCVLVATTLLHSGIKFHSFLYTGYLSAAPRKLEIIKNKVYKVFFKQ